MSGHKENLIQSTFFLAFVGQKIAITVNANHTIGTDMGDGTSIETLPMFYEGILLDYDEEYYYLGKSPNEIIQAVNRKASIHIMVIEDKTVFDEILDQMPEPSEGEVN